MKKEQIENISSKKFNAKEWNPLIKYFWDRYNKRYFNQIEILQNHKEFEIRNNCGFLIVSIDCILIETLEQYYGGSDESIGKSHHPFLLFFNRASAFKKIIKNKEDAGKFAGLIRSGLLHQSKTKKESIINKKSKTPIIGWIDVDDKSKGFEINRDKFHKSVKSEFKNLINEIKKVENVELRNRFKDKISSIV